MHTMGLRVLRRNTKQAVFTCITELVRIVTISMAIDNRLEQRSSTPSCAVTTVLQLPMIAYFVTVQRIFILISLGMHGTAWFKE